MDKKENIPDGEKKSMTLYQKLVEIRKKVEYVQKDTEGGFGLNKHKYATEAQILGMIRPKMDQLGVLLHIQMTDMEIVVCTGKDRQLERVKATFTFTWIDADNPTQTLSTQYILAGDAFDTKSCGALITYAHKYFLYKFFSVPTDKDDPDTFENSRRRAQEEQKGLSNVQVQAITALADEKRIANICKIYSAESLEQVDARHYDIIINGLNTKKMSVGVSSL